MRTCPPLVRQSELTGRVFVLTRYSQDSQGVVTSHEKVDVTVQTLAIDGFKALNALTPEERETLDAYLKDHPTVSPKKEEESQ